MAGERTRSLSRDGHELRFAINFLAPFLLTRSLLQLLKASPPARIVNVASAGQALEGTAVTANAPIRPRT